MWPAIVSAAAGDELLSGVGVAVGIGAWGVGVGLIALGRFLAGRIGGRVEPAECSRGGRPGAAVRTALPFAAGLVSPCTIEHCDVDRASFFDCPETTSPACAALAGSELVLISGTWSTGSSRLREQLSRVPECAG